MILCMNPRCQTTAGCVCGALVNSREPPTSVTLKGVTWCRGCGLPIGICDCKNVATFTGPTKVSNPFEPDPKVVEHCERLLEQARSGKLRGLAYATVTHDDLVPAGEINWGFHSGSAVVYAMGEAISRLRYKWDLDRG